MNDANEITCRLLELISSGSAPEVIAELFSESADWSIPGAPELAPWVGSRAGRESIANFYREFGNHIEPLRFDISAIVADADRAVALGEFECRVKKTGRTVRSEFAIEIQVVDGLISRYRFFEDSFAIAEAAR